MIVVGGRRVKFAKGRGRTQTINICTASGRDGEYDWVLVLDPPAFESEDELRAGPNDSIDSFVSWLQRVHRAEARVTPVRRLSSSSNGELRGTTGRSELRSSSHSGLDDLIDRFLGVEDVGRPPHHAHLTSALRLSGTGGAGLDGAALVPELYARLEQNLDQSKRTPSQENWRYEKKLEIDASNPSREKQLEKAIARLGGTEWVNQTPTSSGLLTSGERQRNIDLVHRLHPTGYEFIELKVESDTPLFAAMEILKNGLVFLYSRRHRDRLGYSLEMNPLLWASEVHLRVLAPAEYYRRLALGCLVPLLRHGLTATLRPGVDQGLTIDFDFQTFPERFSPGALGSELLESVDARRPAYA